jgi:hypothetical protein
VQRTNFMTFRSRLLRYSAYCSTALSPPAFEQCPVSLGCAPKGPFRPFVRSARDEPLAHFLSVSVYAQRTPCAWRLAEGPTTHPSRRATSRVTSLTSGTRATTGTLRAEPLSGRPADRVPAPLWVSSAATMTSGRSAGNMRRAALSVIVTSNPDAVSSYANLARNSSSSIASRMSGRIDLGRAIRPSTGWLFGIPQNPVARTHIATASGMSVGFPTDRDGTEPL